MSLFNQIIKDNVATLEELNKFDSIAESIKGTLHSGCSYDISKHMFLFDKDKMYVVLIKDKKHEVRTYDNIFCCGI